MTGRIVGIISILTLGGLIAIGAVLIALAAESEQDSAHATAAVLAESVARSLAAENAEELADADLEAVLETTRTEASLSGVWVFDTQGRLLASSATGDVFDPGAAVVGREEILAARDAVGANDAITSSGADGNYAGTAPIFSGGGDAVGAVRVRMSLEGLGTELSIFRWEYIVGALLLFAALLLLAYYLAKRLARPLAVMVRAARAVERGSAPEPSVSASLRGISLTRDEYGELAGVFLDMVQEVGVREVRLNALVEERTVELASRNAELVAAQRVLRDDLAMARAVQAALVPLVFPDDARASVAASMTPAREVGGDFYDAFLLDQDRLAFAIADVSGKGVASALFMAVGRALLWGAAHEHSDPSAAVAAANDQLCSMNPKELFITAWFGVVDLRLGTLTYVNAGHDPPYLIEPGEGPVEVPHTGGLALGVFGGIGYAETTIPFPAGAAMFTFTDGITEAQDAGGQLFGKERLEALLATNHGDDADTLVSAVLGALDEFTGDAEQFDDVTCLAVRFAGAAESGGSPNAESAAPARGPSAEGWRRLHVRPELSSALISAQAFVERFAESHGYDAVELFRLNMALDELITNTLEHGFEGNPGDAEITVGLRSEGDSVVCRYEDNGPPFSPFDAAKQDTSLGVEDRPIGGLGIQLIEATLDDVLYERVEERNVTTLRQRRAVD